jgi:hypothetical protein
VFWYGSWPPESEQRQRQAHWEPPTESHEHH